MFKFMKQGISLAAAVAAAGSCIPVYAAGIQTRTSVMASDGSENTETGDGEDGSGTSITISDPVEGHRYKVYQVFKGKVSTDGKKLSNVEYGANYPGREGITLADELAQLEAEGADAKVFAEAVNGFLTGEPAAVLSVESPSADLEAGYYMILDESDGGAGDALSDYIVAVAGNVAVQPKSVSVPEFDKSIDKDWDVSEEKHTISIEDTEPGHSCEIYQIFTGTAGSGGEIENLRYGTNYGTRGDAVPSDIISSIGTPDFEEHIKQELSGSPAAVLASGDPAMDVEAGYYLAVDKDEDGNETGSEFTAVSKDKVITINHAEQAVDLSPETADIDWNYTLHEDTGVITLNYYIGTKTDVKVYSHYKVPDSDIVWKAEIAYHGVQYMFQRNGNIKSVKFSNSLDTSKSTDMSRMFDHCSNLESISFGTSFNTANVRNMNYMFEGCSSLTNIDVSCFDTGKCTTMSRMFLDCSNLESISFGENFNTVNVTNMFSMFSGCRSLINLNVSGFDTSGCIDMRDMFSTCPKLISLDLSNFKTNSVTRMDNMFLNCSSITKINLKSFDTSNVINMSNMFRGCSLLKNLDLSSFNTSNVKNMRQMFMYCEELGVIYVAEGKWLTNQADILNIFVGCGVSEVTYVDETASTFSSILPEASASGLTEENTVPEEYIEIENDDTSVEYGIGDSIPYRLTATMPESIAAYKKYQLAFHDRLSAGLDYDRDSLKVFAGDTEIPAEHYTVAYSEDGKSMTVSIADVKAAPWNAVPGTQIIVKYSAVLNENAQAGNTNEAFLEYSNDPKGDGTGTTGPGVPDTVTVYTFELRFDKVDKNGNALEGAGFTLYKKNDTGGFVPASDEIKGVTRFSFKGLAAGEYKLVETTTPDGYNTMEDLYFNIVAEEAESGGETVKRISIEAPDGSPLSGWTAIGADKAFESDIANYTGSTLPETGGAGTYLLYAAGVAVVITAGTVIAARKKADEE